MRFCITFLTSVLFLLFSLSAQSQYIEKIPFRAGSDTGSYLVIQPVSKSVKGTLLFVHGFYPDEAILAETKLHNVAAANGLLTVYLSTGSSLFTDSAVLLRIQTVVQDLVSRFGADTSRFALAGYDYASNIALRYAELAQEYPDRFPVHPKAVFTVGGPVDLPGLWDWCERQIKKNYYAGTVGDAMYIRDYMQKKWGPPAAAKEQYAALTPFDHTLPGPGNERFLKNTALRLYYDTDIEWQLSNRRNSYYDTYMPDASALVNSLLLQGNGEAAFMAARTPGRKSDGSRNASALSVVDEVDCIHWLKQKLDIFDPVTWQPPYQLATPAGWGTERFPLPPDFAPDIRYTGVEDLRFAPGWGDTASAEHWSYAFLWWLNGKPEVNADILRRYLQAYYTGLVGRNIGPRHIPADKVIPVQAYLQQGKAEPGEGPAYSGRITLLNYMSGSWQPVTLHCRVYSLPGGPAHTALFFELSPRPLQHAVWKSFEQLRASYRLNE